MVFKLKANPLLLQSLPLIYEQYAAAVILAKLVEIEIHRRTLAHVQSIPACSIYVLQSHPHLFAQNKEKKMKTLLEKLIDNYPFIKMDRCMTC